MGLIAKRSTLKETWRWVNQFSKHPRFKLVSYILKLVLTAVILYFVFRGLELRSVLENMMRLSVGVILLLILGSVLRHLIQLTAWRMSLRINPAYVPDLRAELHSYLIGLPLAFAFPGGFAAMGRIFWVKNSSHIDSALAFVVERGFLTWATWSFAATAALMHFPGISPLWSLPLYLVLVTLPLWSKHLFRFWKEGEPYRARYAGSAPRLALLQIIAALIALTQYWLILNSLQHISWLDNFKLMSLTTFSNSIPITLGGLGLRESFAIHFLKDAGFVASEAISATLSLFLIQDVVPALIGLSVLWKKSR